MPFSSAAWPKRCLGGALLVLEDVVGFAQFLEFLLRRRIAVVAVGVMYMAARTPS
jgi:hypothetical protein